MKNKTDKREKKRATWTGLVDLRKNAESPPSEALTINISFGGIAVYTKEPVKGKLIVTFYFQKKDNHYAESVWCKVARINKVGSHHMLGLEFIDLNAKAHKGILSLAEYTTSF